MSASFFVDRPVFASVLSIIVLLAGTVSVVSLPIAQFPQVAPPVVSVSANYPGASARDVAEAVAAPIEQSVNGVEGMAYMSSTCTNDGGYSLTVTFKSQVDIRMALVQVQNRVALAVPDLPDVLKRTGIQVRRRSPDPVVGFSLTSPGGRYDQLYLSNYALRFIREELGRVPGVADINMLGQRDFSLRIWVNPNRLGARGLTPSELVQAIRRQNAEAAAGHVGVSGADAEGAFEVTVDTMGRLADAAEFEQIIIKSMPDGRVVRLRDVARVELGARREEVECRFDRLGSVILIVFQSPDANALRTRDNLIAIMETLAARFPEDIAYDISFDTTPYTRESIREVIKTLSEAVGLVAAVILVFLGNWRAALVPLASVPVAVMGTFAAMALFGFSINNLTLFGLVLAIGIVVDDAIVVVEAVEHELARGLSPRDATLEAMRQVSGPVIAVGLVLSAVFVPCLFIGGITGAFFKQFALTIAVSTLLSAFNSLTLSPALTALLLRPRLPGEKARPPLPRVAWALAAAGLVWYLSPDWLPDHWPAEVLGWAPWLLGMATLPAGWVLGRFCNWLGAWLLWLFERSFSFITWLYTVFAGWMLRISLLMLVAYGGLMWLTWLMHESTPKGFIPSQDMGYLFVSLQLPDAASLERTNRTLRIMEEVALATPGVVHSTAISGQSFALNAAGSNFGTMFIRLAPYEDRTDPELHAEKVVQSLRIAFALHAHEGQATVLAPPPVRGIGRAGGFSFVLEDRGDLGPEALEEQVQMLIGKGAETGLGGLFSVFRAKVPQVRVLPDERQCRTRGVDPRDLTDTLQVFEGSMHINDFTLFDRNWQVVVQADAQFRDQLEDVKRLKVRNREGLMVPVGSVCEIREVSGPLSLNRHNLHPAATINGTGSPGVSSRQSIERMRLLADENIPPSMAYEWTDMSYLELASQGTGNTLFGMAIVMVFLVLAAQFESWSLPAAVILIVPSCLLGAVAGVEWVKQDINIFTQVGFVVLAGLSSKNAILIVEYARRRRLEGATGREAALEACRLRLRPIVMTSLAFVLGVAPMMTAHGAGAEMRRSLGVAVFWGMIGTTLAGLVFTPVFFLVVDWLAGLPALGPRTLIGRFSRGLLDVLTVGPVRRLFQRIPPSIQPGAGGA
ncbi:MAG: efflux RND transporter permease subunit [Planctomycetota bacterium]|nr:efflux RND transporter permease subunit [Planctomycetota bacterium]